MKKNVDDDFQFLFDDNYQPSTENDRKFDWPIALLVLVLLAWTCIWLV